MARSRFTKLVKRIEKILKGFKFRAMILTYNGFNCKFEKVPLEFEVGNFSDVFAEKNNKTLRQTLEHRRYSALKRECETISASDLNLPIGSFLKNLKANGDGLYKRFLNKYGDLNYSRFRLANKSVLDARGLYLYAHEGQLVYIGRCKDSFRKRINQGYGMISPKNCFLDGQATNCNINSRITSFGSERIEFHVCLIPDVQTITTLETGLIVDYRPPWNIQGL
jgi:hypothetical protein